MIKDEIKTFLQSIDFTDIIEYDTPSIIEGYILDFFIPSLKVGVVCNSVKTEQTTYVKDNKNSFKLVGGRDSNYHYRLSKKAYNQDIRIIQIWEDQWYNSRLNPTLKEIIKSALGISKTKHIYARQCQLKEVSKEEYKKFCDTNHTQVSRPAEIRYGLYYQGELCQVASFSKTKAVNRANKKPSEYDYEWVRGCEGFDHAIVVGGVSKLFKHFIRQYNPKSVLCYSDFNLFCGKGYRAAGFELEGFTGNDKFYIDNNNLTRINRSAAKYREYMDKVVSGKWSCCYGAGNLKFVWKNSNVQV